MATGLYNKKIFYGGFNMDATNLSRVVDEQIRRLEEHEIKFPANFRSRLKKEIVKNYASSYRLVSRTTLESIIEMSGTGAAPLDK